mgnify:FL=1
MMNDNKERVYNFLRDYCAFPCKTLLKEFGVYGFRNLDNMLHNVKDGKGLTGLVIGNSSKKDEKWRTQAYINS